jgi:sortase A
MAQDDNGSTDQPGYNLSPKHEKVLRPLHDDIKPETPGQATADPAVELLRKKVNALYGGEPSAQEELQEAEASRHRSKHQQFMYELSNSGKSLAEIQTAWHNYYLELPDAEKHEVWQEFYVNHDKLSQYRKQTEKQRPKTQQPAAAEPATETSPAASHAPAHRKHRKHTTADIKKELLTTVSKRSRTKRSSHMSSILFGLGMGTLVLVILLFSFFNERFIAPFITPSRAVSSTPIIIDPGNTDVGPEPKLIIPKINVEVPVIYDEPSIDEHAVQRALEDGVLHYATTVNPGELGNGVLFGHSSNNILNKGKYKFAFLLLKSLEAGDTFMLQKDGKRYIYKVYEKKIVAPTDVSVLGAQDRAATFTLITCDPPGTNVNRLIVIGEQISPDPAQNVASHVKQDVAKPAILPSNSPSLWQRLTDWLSS